MLCTLCLEAMELKTPQSHRQEKHGHEELREKG
jgi:hypothetical protein